MLENVIGAELEPLQMTWLLTAFTSGLAFTTTVAVPDILFVHVPFVAETKFKMELVVTPEAVIKTVPFDPTVAVVGVPPFKLYVITSPTVPVIVNCAF